MHISPLNLKSITTATLLAALITTTAPKTNAEIVVGQDSEVTNITGQQIIDFSNHPGDDDIVIGYNQHGIVTLNQGSQLILNDTFLGYNALSIGELTLTGQDTKVTTKGLLEIGRDGQGTLNILDGAKYSAYTVNLATNIGSIGTLNITGQNSKLEILSLDYGYVGFNDSTNNNDASNSLISIDPSPVNSFGRLRVGIKGNATLNISDGGEIITSNIYIASEEESNSTINITDQDSLIHSSYLYIGGKGNGTLNISNGAKVKSGIATIGNAAELTNQGIVNITDASSYWNATRLIVGNYSQGTLNISNDASVYAHNLKVGYYGQGSINISGQDSHLTVGQLLTVAHHKSASLNISDNATVNAKIINIGTLGNITLDNGTINVNHLNITTFDKITGTGTINTKGQIYDRSLTLSNPSDLLFSKIITSPNQNITINTDLNDTSEIFGAGNNGIGVVEISNGTRIKSINGQLGVSQNAIGAVNISDQSSQWKIENLEVGINGIGVINISNNGTLRSSSAKLALNENSTGVVNIDGQGAIWHTFKMEIASKGQGALNITNSAKVRSIGLTVAAENTANGTINIQGQESVLDVTNYLYAGRYGQSQINISDGATLNAARAHLTTRTGGSSTVNVQGSGSSFNVADFLNVGVSSQATINLAADTTLNTNTLTIGEFGSINLNQATVNANHFNQETLNRFTGTGTINTQGSVYDQDKVLQHQDDLISTKIYNTQNQKFTLNTDLTQTSYKLGAGSTGTGSLTIKNAGMIVNSTHGAIGELENSNGTVTVSHSATWAVNETLTVGSLGKGTLNVNNAGLVTAKNLRAGSINGSTINIDGQNSKILIALSTQFGTVNEGTMNITNGATLETKTITMGGFGLLTAQPSYPPLTTGLILEDLTELEKITIGHTSNIPNQNFDHQASITVDPNTLSSAGITNSQGSDLVIFDPPITTATLNLSGQGSTLVTEKFSVFYKTIANINISDSAQLIVTDDFTLGDLSILTLTLDDLSSPFVTVGGVAKIKGMLNIITDNLTDLTFGDTFTILELENDTTTKFKDLEEGDITTYHNGLGLAISYLGGDGNDVTLTAIPEPTTLLTILTLAPLTLTRRKQK